MQKIETTTIEYKEYKASQSQLDATYSFRENKKRLTFSLYPSVYAKLLMLCKFCGNKNSGKGSSFRSIITSLVLDEHISSNVDMKFMGLLKKHEGLLKNATNIFQINLNINPTMLLLAEALNRIHKKTEVRKRNKVTSRSLKSLFSQFSPQVHFFGTSLCKVQKG